MRPTSPELLSLLLHLTGHEPLRYVLDRGYRLDMSAGKRGALPSDFLDSFGKREFYAAVGFVDMRDFSTLACGKSPSEVRSLVAPFLTAVIAAAANKKCFVDKTIGDEVMLVMPCGFGDGEALSDLTWVMTDILEQLNQSGISTGFSAGFALGMVLLDQIQAQGYSEWTVYGACVNGAKRLQTLADPSASPVETPAYRLVVGAIDSEHPSFDQHVTEWLEANGIRSPIEYFNRRVDCQLLKGVGKMCFLSTHLRRR
jgi:class 3 adenylate cyclase